jgi:DNA-binding NarL/FixJ family response regulator
MEDTLEVCAQVGTAAEAIKAVSEFKPDLLVLDLSLPDKHGLELIKDMQAMYPDVLLLALSMHDESLYAERVLRAGARGYLMKKSASDYLVKAVHRVLDGGIYLSEEMSGAMLELLSGKKKTAPGGSGLEKLTDREIEVFQLIGSGKSSRQIAEQLHLSMRTVDAHRAHIKDKLGLPDGVALVRHAVRWAESQAAG